MIDAPGAGALHPLVLYVRIALLKAGPDDLPVSRTLLPFTVAGYVLVGLLLGSLVAEGAEGGALLVALDTAFTLAWYWVCVALVFSLALLSQLLALSLQPGGAAT